MGEQVQRREFLKTLAITGAAIGGTAALQACGDTKTTTTDAGTDAGTVDTFVWDKSAEVVVVGGGGTGLAAAIEAAAAGVSVLVLEKGAATGGATLQSGGVMQAAGTTWQATAGVTDDTAALFKQSYMIQGEGLVDEALVTDHTANMKANLEWLAGLGLKFTSVYGHCHVPYLDDAGCDRRRIHVYEGGGAGGGGKVMTDIMLAKAKAAGAQFALSTEVTELITDGTKGVVGVRAKDATGSFTVKATRGVIIATSGMDHCTDLTRAFNPQQYWNLTNNILVLTVKTNTGDGIRMGMKIGAALETCGGTIDFDAITGQGTSDAAVQVPCIFVNGQGQRFVCEDSTYAYMERAIYQQQLQHQKPTYMVMDTPGILKTATWSDASKVADAVTAGTLIKADTIAALATAINVPAANLTATLARWNAMIAADAKDVDFRRNTQLTPIATGPFYAMKNVPYGLGAIGGLKINVETQVLDQAGVVIPHLFAGGLAAGGWIGPYYPGSGTAVGGAVHWGRKAGKNAAATAAWT